jgi:TPR repeat protein
MYARSRFLCHVLLGLLFAASNAHGSGTESSGHAAAQSNVPELKSRAARGDVDAQVQLAVAYEDGVVLTRDVQESVRWYRAAAEAGNLDAQASLGALYALNLEDLPADYAESLAWSRRAAAQDNAQAQYNLGVMYRDGLGALQDVDQAVHWNRLAALQRYPAAYYNLGVMYFNGAGVKQDRAFAYALFTLAESSAEVQGERESGPAQMAAQAMTEQDIAVGVTLAARMAEHPGDTLDAYLSQQNH